MGLFFLRSAYLRIKKVFLFDKSVMFRINVINVMRTISVVNLLKTVNYRCKLILTNRSAFSVALYTKLTEGLADWGISKFNLVVPLVLISYTVFHFCSWLERLC